MDKCLKNDILQDEILNLRIKAQKKYKMNLRQQFLLMKKNIMVKLNIKNLKK